MTKVGENCLSFSQPILILVILSIFSLNIVQAQGIIIEPDDWRKGAVERMANNVRIEANLTTRTSETKPANHKTELVSYEVRTMDGRLAAPLSRDFSAYQQLLLSLPKGVYRITSYTSKTMKTEVVTIK